MVLNFQDVLEYDSEKIKQMHPTNLKNQLDKAAEELRSFSVAQRALLKNKTISRSDWHKAWEEAITDFGKWSHLFNKIVKEQIILFAEEENIRNNRVYRKFCNVYAYWWNTYRLLQEVYSNKSVVSGSFALKRIMKERNKLASSIEGDFSMDKLEEILKEIVKGGKIKINESNKSSAEPKTTDDKMS